MGFMDSAIYAKISAICLVLALLLFLIAFADPHWSSTSPTRSNLDLYIGLWRSCVNPIGGSQACTNFIDYTSGDWLKASQSFMTLSFFGLLASIGAVAVAAFVGEFEGEPKVMAGAIVATGVTSVLMLLGVAIWGGRYTEYFLTHPGLLGDPGQLDWAFGVAVTSLILTFSSCVLMVVEALGDRIH